MKRLTITLFLLAAVFGTAAAQEEDAWTLERCIEHARENSIDVRTKEISRLESDEDLRQAKAQRYPTLNFSTNHNLAIQNTTSYNDFMERSDNVSYSGNYGLNAGVTLYAGSKLQNALRQEKARNAAAGYDLEQAKMDIEISVTQAYIQVLYNREALAVSELAAQLSETQVKRGEGLLAAGTLSKSGLAQLQSQAASDNYQAVTARNALSSALLSLKQLLELDPAQPFAVAYPETGTAGTLLPSLDTLYRTALAGLPQMQSSRLNYEASEIAVRQAKGGRLPTISLNAGISTSTFTGTTFSFAEQFGKKLNESVGLSLSIPIFNGRQAKTGIRKAELQRLSAELQVQSAGKQLYSTLESLYNDAISARSQYAAAEEQLAASQESFELVSAQFEAGLKNTVELITEKNNYLSALAGRLQAKYQLALASRLLNLYLTESIE